MIVSNIATQETKKRAAGMILAALKIYVIPKWSSKRHSKMETAYSFCCKMEILNIERFGKLRKLENGLMWSVTTDGH